jgi:hypothetical protein
LFYVDWRKMTTLLERVNSFNEVTHKKTRRSPDTYAAIAEWAPEEIRRCVDLYLNYQGNLPYKKRLYRDGIDFPLRRYHEYCIQQRIGHHYIQVGLDEKGVFEHMVPLSTIRDMVIAGVLTPEEACNMPTCRISKASDQLLRDNGLASTSPDIYNFWKRYDCLDQKFVTYEGESVDKKMTLSEHFGKFLSCS